MNEQPAPVRAPLVGIVMGSDSDWPVMEQAALALDEFGVPYEADVVSAHRMPTGDARLRDRAPPTAGCGCSSPAPAAPRTCPGCSPR